MARPAPHLLRPVAGDGERGWLRRWRSAPTAAWLVDTGGSEEHLLDTVLPLLGDATGPRAAWMVAMEGPADAIRYALDLATADALPSRRASRTRLIAGPAPRPERLRSLLEAAGGGGLVALVGGDPATVNEIADALHRDPAATVGRAAVTLLHGGGAATAVILAAPGSAGVAGLGVGPGPAVEAPLPTAARPRGQGRLVLAGAAVAVLVGLLGLEVARSGPTARPGAPLPTPTQVVDQNALPVAPLQTHRRSGAAPTARVRPASAWDAGRGQLVLFGGAAQENAPVDLADTWSWTETGGWRRESPAGSPPPRVGAVMAADPRGVVLVGGTTRQPEPHALHDSWRWDGHTWTQLADGPPLGTVLTMATDPRRGEVVLVVRGDAAGSDELVTWTLGADRRWTRRPVPTPAMTVLATDAAGGVAGLAVETGELSARSTTWRWDGSAWQRAAVPNEPQLDVLTATLAPSAAAGPGGLLLVEVDVLGPEGGAGGTWAFDGHNWTRHPGPIPAFIRSTDVTTPVLAGGGEPVLIGGSLTAGDAYRHAARWDGSRWRDLAG